MKIMVSLVTSLVFFMNEIGVSQYEIEFSLVVIFQLVTLFDA